jgi:hypothetical protein
LITVKIEHNVHKVFTIIIYDPFVALYIVDFSSPLLYSINVSENNSTYAEGYNENTVSSCQLKCTDKVLVSFLIISFCMKTWSCFCFVTSLAPPSVFQQKFGEAIP